MAGSRNKKVISDFYCINCGKMVIPVWRKKAHLREPGHRKALYCVNCKQIVNHIEIRTGEEAVKFHNDFAAGKYREEAKKSIKYVKEKEKREDENL